MRDTAAISILVVEDSKDLATNIADYLESKGYLVDVAMDGVTGLHLAVTNVYDAIVLDLMLPGIDGLGLCRRLRQDAQSFVPVLILSARITLTDKVAGFSEGADDYLVKPFEPKELLLRINAILRRLPSLLTDGGQVLACCNDPEIDASFLLEEMAQEAPELRFVELAGKVGDPHGEGVQAGAAGRRQASRFRR